MRTYDPKNPLFAFSLSDVIQIIKDCPLTGRYTYGEHKNGAAHLIEMVSKLPTDKQGRADSSKVANTLRDCETGKMPGGANSGIDWIIRNLKSKRIPLGPLFKINAYSYNPTPLSYDDKRIHLQANFELTCKHCGEESSRPGTDFLCYPKEGKVIESDCVKCGEQSSLFELESVDGEGFVIFREAGASNWDIKINGQVETLKYKGTYS